MPLNPVPNLVFGKSGEAGEAVCSFTERSKDYPCGWPPGPRPQKQLRVGHRLIPSWTANVCRTKALYGFFGSLFYLLFGGLGFEFWAWMTWMGSDRGRFRILNFFSNCHCDFWPTLGNTLGIHRVSVEAAGVQLGERFCNDFLRVGAKRNHVAREYGYQSGVLSEARRDTRNGPGVNKCSSRPLNR